MNADARTGVRTKVRDVGSSWAALSGAERRVAELVADGHTNKEIATQLFVSSFTVQSQLRSIFLKLGLHSRAAVAVVADRHRRRSATPTAHVLDVPPGAVVTREAVGDDGAFVVIVARPEATLDVLARLLARASA